jgi:catechol 2,3-dioxygenase-like lactoylglutathione lyase family enzyme
MFRARLREQDGGGRHVLAAHDRAAASRFYTGLLRGRQVRPTGRRTDGARLWFRIDDVLVETGPGTDGGGPVLVHVDDPLAVAERCWDAGFTVRFLDPPFGDAIVSVTDPFGRQVNLVPAARHDARHAANGE